MLLATSRSITLETRHSKLSAVDQKGSPKQWRDILTQQRYSTIELECLAIVLAVQKCSICLRGLPSFRILTDHRPLQGISQKYLFDLTSPRLQRMREKIAMYNFIIQWTPGKSHLLADALSRAPLFTPKDLPGFEMILSSCAYLSYPILLSTPFTQPSTLTTVSFSRMSLTTLDTPHILIT